jgi:hypothetical protein
MTQKNETNPIVDNFQRSTANVAQPPSAVALLLALSIENRQFCVPTCHLP